MENLGFFSSVKKVMTPAPKRNRQNLNTPKTSKHLFQTPVRGRGKTPMKTPKTGKELRNASSKFLKKLSSTNFGGVLKEEVRGDVLEHRK
jgi:hypothetical protein